MAVKCSASPLSLQGEGSGVRVSKLSTDTVETKFVAGGMPDPSAAHCLQHPLTPALSPKGEREIGVALTPPPVIPDLIRDPLTSAALYTSWIPAYAGKSGKVGDRNNEPSAYADL